MSTTEQATLIAAALAAAVSLISLFVTLITGRASEFRAAHRQVLGDVLAPLGQAIYEVVAAPAILHRKVRSREALENWRGRGTAAADRLKDLRLRVRYSLWGLDEGLRVLSRVPDWVSNFQDRSDEGELLLLQASGLRDELDLVLMKKLCVW